MTEVEIPHIIAGASAVLARRYAHALYDMAEERRQLDAVAEDLRTLKSAIRDNDGFYQVSHNPRLTRKQLVVLARKMTEMCGVGTLAASFVALLAHNRRLRLLADMADMYLHELAKRRGEYTALVTIPRSLTSAQQEALAKRLGKMTGGTVKIAIKEDKSLLGGLIVKVGSHLVDASLKGKLARIERQLKAQEAA